MTPIVVDKTATCSTCGWVIEHYEGEPEKRVASRGESAADRAAEVTPEDRIVDHLIRENGLAETTSRESDVAVVLRAVREELAIAQMGGQISDLAGADLWLSQRIAALTGQTSGGHRMCDQCGRKVAQFTKGENAFCGDVCESNWTASEYRGWYPR